MAANLKIDEDLLNEPLRLGGKKTKRETVNEALAEYVARRKQKEILKYVGLVEFREGYDHKKIRERKR